MLSTVLPCLSLPACLAAGAWLRKLDQLVPAVAVDGLRLGEGIGVLCAAVFAACCIRRKWAAGTSISVTAAFLIGALLVLALALSWYKHVAVL